MQNALLLVMLAAVGAALVGLVRPSVVLPARWKPGRLKVVMVYGLLAFGAILAIGATVSPEERAQLAQQRAERDAKAAIEADARKIEQQRIAAEQEAAAAQARVAAERAAAERAVAEAKAREEAERVEAAERGRGIGVGRMPAFLAFQGKYDIEPAAKVGRLERWMGQGKLGIVELLGAENNLTAMTVMVGVVKDDLAGNIARIGDMNAALLLAFPKWSGAKDWLINAFTRLPKEPKQTMTRDGLLISLSHIQGLGMVSLTIDSRADHSRAP